VKKFFLIFFCVVFLSSCSPVSISRESYKLNTLCQITVYSYTDEKILDGAFEIIDKYERLLSKNIEVSDIYKLNHANGSFVEISSETYELLKRCIEYYKLSEGLFDITLGNATSLWDFTGNKNTPPDAESIKQAIKNIGCENIVLENNKAALKNEVTIDLGGVAKGYIGDKVKEYLIENNVKSAIINLGGNVVLVGDKNNDDFTVAIKDPSQKNGGLLNEKLYLKDKSIVTSGIYERYFEYNSKTYHHILDPKTGYPCESDISGVTVIGDSSELCDAYSTICLLYGSQKAIEFLEANNMQGIIITLSGKTIKTKGW